MNKELVIIIGVSIIALLFLVLFIKTKVQLCRLSRELLNKTKDYNRLKNRYSMIEYYHRNFKEGMNPYTVLRDISNTFYDEIYEEEINESKEENRT